jgi:hypothetical protein
MELVIQQQRYYAMISAPIFGLNIAIFPKSAGY